MKPSPVIGDPFERIKAGSAASYYLSTNAAQMLETIHFHIIHVSQYRILVKITVSSHYILAMWNLSKM